MPRRSTPVRLTLALLLAAFGLAGAAASAQASAVALINDCMTNGRIVGHYSAQDYSQALANLPTDVAEYSDCAGVIRRAELAAAAGNGNRSANLPVSAAGAAAAANPRQNPLDYAAASEKAAVAQAQRSGSAQVDVGGQLLRPGVVAARTSTIFNALPTPLLIALGALVLVGLAVCGRYARDLVRARRPG
jgi:hypothetical protein